MIYSKEKCFYLPADDLWIVTCYFNPCGYASRKKNFLDFILDLEHSQLNYLAIECAFSGEEFELPPSKRILRVRSNSVLWQKERLLNIAIANLPNNCKKIAWLDGDLKFASSDWAIEASELLQKRHIVQLFEKAVLMAPDAQMPRDDLSYRQGFVSTITSTSVKLNKMNYLEHGHTGFGWAARREILDATGLYDRCIIGGADHAMAHAAYGSWDSECLKACLGNNPALLSDFTSWADKFYNLGSGNLACVSGMVLHKWHGIPKNRLYGERSQKLTEFTFDPLTDIALNNDGCWEWNSDKPLMHEFVKNYFQLRQEDYQQTENL